jgi:opacity protein-like surface antigen
MKKKLSVVAISALLSTGVMAADFIDGGIYGGVGIGFEDYSHYSAYDPGMTLVLNGGKPIIKLGPGVIGAEGELTYTVVPLSHTYWSDLNILTLGAYATYTYDFSDKLYSRAKLGIVHRDYSYDSHYSDYNSVGVAAGIGAGFKFTDKMRLFSDIILVDGSNLTQLNIGVQMSF